MTQHAVTQHARPRSAGPAPGGEGEVYAGFRAAALAAPRTPAVISPDGAITSYGALLDAVEAAAARLATALGPGDVLGLAVDDPVAFVAVYLAASKRDQVTVLLDGRMQPHGTPQGTARFDVTVLAVADGAGSFGLSPVAGREQPGGVPAPAYLPDDFVVHCTSGSTGEPKGIVMTEAAVSARVRLWAGEMELTAADTVLCALPLWHCHGIDVLTLPALLSGATVVLARGDRLTGRGLALIIRRHGVTVMSGLPVMYGMLTDASSARAGDLSSLRLAISGSAPLDPAVQTLFHERFGLPLRQVYGLSEIAVICFDRRYTGRGSIGLPVAGVEHRLEPVPEEDAHEGPAYELYVRGPGLARGYYSDPAATAEMFEDGWLRTRDLVRADADGWYVLGRRSTFVNVAGSKVGPLEVEAALRDCPGVLDTAVVGVPDARTTERIAAVLVTGDGFDLAAVRRRLAERMHPHQLPRQYHVTAALPRTPLGKTDYAAVKRLVLDQEGKTT
ncbi:class I adenylate-forming enzyme family protein [Streptomyces sp. NPDC002908]|uniref:class I adenylate-forming enzyme family protein n=1 Tax=Streptomyces sp. NPDC002908 TaxID=3364670 RepID=UPI00367FD31F